MAVLPIVQYPDSRLRIKARPVSSEMLHASEFSRLVDEMFETMYAASGIGLAATQVDIHHRFMVIDVSENKQSPYVFINPEIVFEEGQQIYREGCLSLPGVFSDVTRSQKITVQYVDRQGQTQTLDADGVLSVCIQHEMDHLEGRLFIDRLSSLKREMIRKKLAKQRHHVA